MPGSLPGGLKGWGVVGLKGWGAVGVEVGALSTWHFNKAELSSQWYGAAREQELEQQRKTTPLPPPLAQLTYLAMPTDHQGWLRGGGGSVAFRRVFSVNGLIN